jgi:hypothetical protein
MTLYPQDLQEAQQLGGQLGELLSGAWAAALSPFAIFGDAWLLNLLFLVSLSLLAYGLVVLAPRQ